MTLRRPGALLSIVSLGLAVSVLSAAQPEPSPEGVSPAAIGQFVAEYQRQAGLAGVAVVVTRGTEVIVADGYGTDDRGKRITGATPLPIASLSKSFTSLAVMQLVDQGKVSLDAPVTRYLPEFALADPRGARITVRQILSHTSGLSDQVFREKSGPQPDSLRSGVALLRTATLSADPGSRAQYHNPNYWLAARMIEVVSGESFADYLDAHIFRPLGMSASRTVGSLRRAPDVSRGHVRFYGRLIPLQEPQWFLDGAAGIVTTAEDLARWLIANNNGGITAGGVRVVSAEGLRTLHEGLGWRSQIASDRHQIGHEGLMFTFTAQQLLLPDSGYGIAVVANRGFGLLPMDSEEIAGQLADMTRGEVPSPGPPVALILEAFVGGLTVLSGVFGIRAFRSARRWAAKAATRRTWRNALSVARPIVPAVLLVSLPRLVGGMMGARDLNWVQTLYVAPTVTLWLLIATGLSVAVAGRRWISLSALPGR